MLVLGIPIPSQFAWVFGLALSHLCSPDTSFAGHISGVLAGISYAYVLKPGEAAPGGGPHRSRRRISAAAQLHAAAAPGDAVLSTHSPLRCVARQMDGL